MLKKDNFISEINFLLKKLKIKRNDNLLIHSNSAGINQIQKNKKNKNQYYNLFIDTLLKKIGKKGTLVMPTYNYDFAKGKNFNYKITVGQVGELNNFFLKRKDVTRSFEPIFSHAIKGPLLNNLLNSNIKNCFSKDSIFEKFKLYDFKIFGFSCLLNTMTFLHYIEEQSKVNYRFYKNFSGKYEINGTIKKIKLSYFVGKKKLDYGIKHKNVEKALQNTKSFHKTNFGYFTCWTINALPCYKIISKKIKNNVNYLIKKN